MLKLPATSMRCGRFERGPTLALIHSCLPVLSVCPFAIDIRRDVGTSEIQSAPRMREYRQEL
jgi:hypothetical protein